MPGQTWDQTTLALAAALPLLLAGAGWLGWRAGRAAGLRRGRADLDAVERCAGLGRIRAVRPDGGGDWSEGARRLFGLAPPAGETPPEALFAPLDPAGRDRLRQILATVAAGTPSAPVELRLTLADASRRVIAARAEPDPARPAPARPVTLHLQDVTERRALEAELDGLIRELLRSNAELEQFASVASHDLRQPLRAVSIYVSLLEEDLHGQLPADAASSLAAIRDGVRRMERLITDLLEYARVGRAAEARLVPLAEVIAAACADLAFEIAETGARLDLPADLPVLTGNQGEMERLWLNLLGNAIKYRAPDRPPRVQVSCTLQGESWLIHVADNGIGIPADQAERVFGLFQRLHSREAYPGTGIGLAIARKIAERHGGSLRAEPAPQGARFALRWPRR